MKKVTRSLSTLLASVLLITNLATVCTFATFEYNDYSGEDPRYKYYYTFEGQTRYTAYNDLIEYKTIGEYDYQAAFKYLELLNEQRVKNGLPPAIMNKKAMEVSMRRARELSAYFSHVEPDGYKNHLAEACAVVGEYDSPAERALTSFNNSKDHYEIIMDTNLEQDCPEYIGVGFYRDERGYYYCCHSLAGVYYNRYDELANKSDYPNTEAVTSVIPASKTLLKVDKWWTTIEGQYANGNISLFSQDSSEDMTFNWGGDIVKGIYRVKGDYKMIPTSNLTFTSTNNSVVSINNKGEFAINNAGVAAIKATLKEDPSVYFERKITVKPKELWDGYFSFATRGYYYNGTKQEPIVLNNNSLVEGKDYTVQYENNIGDPTKYVTTAKAIITGINNYTGVVEETFQIYGSPCMKRTGNSYSGYYITYNHNFSSQWTIDSPATCTTEGSKSHHCTVCGEKTDVTVIPKTSHTFGEWKTTKQATCTSDGVQTRTCSGCGKSETKAITAIGHSYTSKITKQPTCTNAGVRTYTCSNCNNTYTEAIKANGHSYSKEWTIDKKATCTSEGSKSHHCLVCNAKADVTVVPKAAHTYRDYVVEKEPTCAETGIKTFRCTVCNQSIREEIPKLDHNYSSEEILSPTCVDTGSVLLTCSDCGESHVEAVPAKGHNYTAKVVKPSYTAQGYTIHTCIDCGYSYKDNYTSKFVLGNVSGFKVPVTNANAVKLTWNKTKNATGYVIYRVNAKTKKWSRVAKVKTNVYVDQKLTSGTTYKYAIRAYITEQGKEILSPKYPTVITSTLPATVNFKLASARGKTVVKWSKTRGATGYVVYYKTSAKGKWYRLKVTKGTSYTTTKLRRGRTYYFTVRAYKNLNGKNYYGSFTTKKITAK